MRLYNALKMGDRHACLISRDGFQLVNGPHCVGQTTSSNHGDMHAASCKHGCKHQGHRVSHTTGAVLVWDGAPQFVFIPAQHHARISHSQCQCNAFIDIQIFGKTRPSKTQQFVPLTRPPR